MTVLTVGYALLVLGGILLVVWLATQTHVFLKIGILYIFLGLAILGLRYVWTAYFDMQRADRADERTPAEIVCAGESRDPSKP